MVIYRMVKKFIETTIDLNQLANWFGSNFIFKHSDLFPRVLIVCMIQVLAKLNFCLYDP